MDFQKQLAHTRKYAEAFWQHEVIDRPYIAVTAPIRPTAYRWSPTFSAQTCLNESYDDILKPFCELVENTYYAGEAMPNLELTLGPDQYAGFLGGKIETSSENYTTWVLPCLDSIEGFRAVIDESPDGYFMKLKKYFEYAAKAADGRFMLNMLDLHSNLDAISALRGAEGLCFDIMDYPEEVHRVLDEVNATFGKVYDMAYESGNMADVGTIGWSPIYCRGRSAVLQCDFSCVLSPAQGREYLFPSIEEEASHLDHVIYHLDGKDALCHLDTLLAMDCIDCIQWVPGAGQPRTLEWMDLLKKIQSAGKSLWLYDWTPDEIRMYAKELRPELVAFSVWVGTPDEADSLVEALKL